MLPPVALVIHSLHTFELTDDGQYLMLNGDQLDSIALHHSVMHQLLAAVSNAIGWSRRIRQNENDMRFAMPCEAWAIGKDKGEATHLVITFRLPGGAELSFRMHRADARQMTEVLLQVTGLAKVNCASGVTLQ